MIDNLYIYIQGLKNVLDRFVVENFDLDEIANSDEIRISGPVMRAYIGAHKFKNLGDVTDYVITSREFFDCLGKVISRDRTLRAKPFWNGFAEEILEMYPVDNQTGYRMINQGDTLIYRGEEDFLPWVVSQRYHPVETGTYLDNIIGDEIFNGLSTIEDLVAKYGDLNPYELAYKIQDERDTSNWYPSEEE